MVAELGVGRYEDVKEAMNFGVKIEETLYPTNMYSEILQQRFAVYKELYPALKEHFKQLGGIVS